MKNVYRYIFAMLIMFITVSDAGNSMNEDVQEVIKGDDGKRYILETIRNYKTGLSRIEEMRLAEVIVEESIRCNLDPMFVIALIERESLFFNWARSDRGAMGLMQIRGYVGKDIANDLNIDWDGEHTLLDPYTNVRIGLYYFNVLKDKFDKTELALAAYNFGPTYVRDLMDADKEVPLDFAEGVFDIYQTHLDEFRKIKSLRRL